MEFRVLLLALLPVVAWAAPAGGDPSSAPTPVLVELFTSEGCSSCPPADQLLIELDQSQGAGGAEIIALGEHVDYWDHLGWRDRFSSAQFSRRQNDYAARFRLDSVYTPQMVLDGKYEFVGNDAGKVRQALADAGRSRKPSRVALQREGENSLSVRVENAGKASPEVLLAITESGLSTKVGGGENGGRTVRHTAVVRRLQLLGKTKDGSFNTQARLETDAGWRRENLKAVVFVQDAGSREILGAAAVPLK